MPSKRQKQIGQWRQRSGRDCWSGTAEGAWPMGWVWYNSRHLKRLIDLEYENMTITCYHQWAKKPSEKLAFHRTNIVGMISQILNDRSKTVDMGKGLFWHRFIEEFTNGLPSLANAINKQLVFKYWVSTNRAECVLPFGHFVLTYMLCWLYRVTHTSILTFRKLASSGPSTNGLVRSVWIESLVCWIINVPYKIHINAERLWTVIKHKSVEWSEATVKPHFEELRSLNLFKRINNLYNSTRLCSPQRASQVMHATFRDRARPGWLWRRDTRPAGPPSTHKSACHRRRCSRTRCLARTTCGWPCVPPRPCPSTLRSTRANGFLLVVS